MTKGSHVWFYRYSARNGGDMANVSRELREQILDLRAAGKTKRQICEQLGIHMNTVKMTTWKARQDADPRAFANYKPKLMASCDSVLELRNYAWFVRGLAERLEVHYTQAEALLNDVIEDVKAKASK